LGGAGELRQEERKACGGGAMDGGPLVVAVLAAGAGLGVAVLVVAAVWFVRGWRFRLLRYRVRRFVRGRRYGASPDSRWERA